MRKLFNVQTKAQVKDSQRSLIAEDELDQKFIVTEEQLELRRELRDKFNGEDVLLHHKSNICKI